MKEIQALIFDVDDTLIPFSSVHPLAVVAVGLKAASFLNPEDAQRFKVAFDRVYRLLQRRHNDMLSEDEKHEVAVVHKLIEELEVHWPKEYGVKIWSREIHAKAAAMECKLEITGQQAVEIAEAYWTEFAAQTKPHPGVKEALDHLKDLGKRVFLLVGSDTRVYYSPKKSEFVYDPGYSTERKLERIMLLQEKFALAFDEVVIADPYDKPNVHAFAKVLQVLKEEGITPSQVAMVGDSYASDLTPAAKLGVGHLYYIDWNHKSGKPADEKVQVIHDFEVFRKL